MASKKRKRVAKKATAAAESGGRIHIRTVTAQQAANFHAYASRRGMNLTALVVSLLMKCLDEEKSLQPEVEQI
jgi:hypothetical protein